MPNQTLLDALKQAQWILDEILDDEKDRDGITCLDNDLRDHAVKTVAMLSTATTCPSTPERDSTIEECALLMDAKGGKMVNAAWAAEALRALKGKAAIDAAIQSAKGEGNV
jgi:hypothetical protein